MLLSSLQANPRVTSNACKVSARAVVVELLDQRLIAIQSLKAAENDSRFCGT